MFPTCCQVPRLLSVRNRIQWGQRRNVKEGLKLTPMSSFDIEQGGVDSRPVSRGVPEWVWTDGPGFSLCTTPLELSGPGFRGVSRRLVNEQRFGGVLDRRCWRGLGARGGVKACNLN